MTVIRLEYLKGLLSVSLCLVGQLSFAAPVVGYGYSTAKISDQTQEQFYLGFEFAMKTRLKKALKPAETFLLKTDLTGSELAAAKIARELLDSKVSLLTGFPSSHEALLVAPLVKNTEVLTIFTAAGHTELGNFGPNVYSAMISMEVAIKRMLEFCHKHFPGKKGALIVNPRAVFSTDFHATVARLQKKIPVSLTPILLNPELEIPPKELPQLRDGTIKFVLFATYADDSDKAMQEIDRFDSSLPVVGFSGWMSSELEFLRKHLAPRKGKTYTYAIWQRGSPTSLPFEKSYKQAFGREPSTEIAYGYDLGVVVAEILNRVETAFSPKAITDAFHKDRCFKGTTAGTLCFGPNGGHALREITFLKFTKEKGFVPVE